MDEEGLVAGGHQMAGFPVGAVTDLEKFIDMSANTPC